MDTYRCFIAIELPEELKEQLVELQSAFRGWPGRVKWVEKQNFHLTLKFFGEIDAARVKVVQDSLKQAGTGLAPFEVNIEGLGVFPGPRSPKVIWAGVKDPDGHLADLRARVEKEMVAAGFPPEAKPFSPHLTLGRIRDSVDSPGLGEIIKKTQIKRKVLPVREVALMKSELTRYGPLYSCLATYSLQPN